MSLLSPVRHYIYLGTHIHKFSEATGSVSSKGMLIWRVTLIWFFRFLNLIAFSFAFLIICEYPAFNSECLLVWSHWTLIVLFCSRIRYMVCPLQLFCVLALSLLHYLNSVNKDVDVVVFVVVDTTVILLPPCPASLMHKSPQRRKIIHDMRPVGCKDRSIDLKMFL